MYYRSKSLCKYLNQYKRIIIYGAGTYAKEIYPYLVEGGLKNKILCFSQTDKKETTLIDGIPVTAFGDIACNQVEDVILIAVSALYEDEIKCMLFEQNYFNVVSLVEYRVEGMEMCHFSTAKAYYEFLTDWYVETHVDEVNKKEIIGKFLYERKSDEYEIDSNLVVMICGHMSIRSNKIISALKRKEIRIVMLDYSSNNHTWCFDELKKMNLECYHCCCIEELLYKAMQYRPLVYFFEPLWGDCLWAKAMMINKEFFGKVVIALYDVMNDGYAGIPYGNLETEKYALENADGIVWRWFSKEYLEEKGFRYKGKSIQFIDYCLHKARESKQDINNQIVKLCAISGWGEAYVRKKEYRSDYIDFVTVEEILAKIGNREDCIFHFYVGSLTEESIEKCKQYEQKYKNFRFYLNVEHGSLLNQLEDYDYFCNLYTDGIWPSNDAIVGGVTGSNMRNSIRNSFFDCLSAGLPIITTVPQKCVEYLSHYEVIIKMNLSTIDIDYLKRNRSFYKNKARIACKKLDIDKHIVRLINFFREV